MAFMSQPFAIDCVGSDISLVIADHNKAFAWHCDYFWWHEILRWLQWAQQVTECCVNENWTICCQFVISRCFFLYCNCLFDIVFDLPVDPDTTSPSSALITTAVTACSCPVNVARGVGTSPSPTMLWVRAFQCHSKTVQSAEPDAI